VDIWLTSIGEEGCETYTQVLISEDTAVVSALRDSGIQAHVGATLLGLLDKFTDAHAGEQHP
jgi:hypothetical protein